MADPKLVLETDPDDVVLESIAPISNDDDGPTVAIEVKDFMAARPMPPGAKAKLPSAPLGSPPPSSPRMPKPPVVAAGAVPSPNAMAPLGAAVSPAGAAGLAGAAALTGAAPLTGAAALAGAAPLTGAAPLGAGPLLGTGSILGGNKPRPGALPPPPSQTSLPKLERLPPPPPRGAPKSGTNPRILAERLKASSKIPDSSNSETIPAPARSPSGDTSARWQVPSGTADRSTVTAREASLQSQQAPVGPPPLASSAPTVPPPGAGTSPGFRTAVTPASVRSNAALPALPSAALGSAPKSGLASSGSSFNTASSPGTPARGELAAYKEQSALMRMLAPFIEDPRPRWLLAFYFLVGVGAGLGAAFGLWGQ